MGRSRKGLRGILYVEDGVMEMRGFSRERYFGDGNAGSMVWW